MKSIHYILNAIVNLIKPIPKVLVLCLCINGVFITVSHANGSSERALIVSAGLDKTCAVLLDGTIKCWGYNNFSSIGNGNTNERIFRNPTRVRTIKNAISLSVGRDFACALLDDGRVRCWGVNQFGQLGDGRQSSESAIPVTVRGITNAISISAGFEHACAVLSNGRIKCWGRNTNGILGNGNLLIQEVYTPITVVGINNAKSITTGGDHSCALLHNGRVKCWGINYYGQLGNDFISPTAHPTTVIGVNNVFSLHAGYDHTCAGIGKGKLKCWGSNIYGQMGNGTSTPFGISYEKPIIVEGIKSVISTGDGGIHECAVLTTGRIKCWGANYEHQAASVNRSIIEMPMTVIGITNATSVSTGSQHTCAVLAKQTLVCWGNNDYGQLGDGTRRSSRVPVIINL